jgi:hypothetical protein
MLCVSRCATVTGGQTTCSPFHAGLSRACKNSLTNLRLGAAMLAMWQEQHPDIDGVFADSVPHRSAVAHFGWGDIVRGTGSEDRAFIARRRMVNRYLDTKVVPAQDRAWLRGGVAPWRAFRAWPRAGRATIATKACAPIVAWTSTPRLASPSAASLTALYGSRDSTCPVGCGHKSCRPSRWRPPSGPPLGPGGLFICIRHVPHIFSCYMHLQSYRVAINDHVTAGQIVANVGHSGGQGLGHPSAPRNPPRRATPSIPRPILGPDFVIPPQETVAHDIAMANKKHRLVKRAPRTLEGPPRRAAKPVPIDMENPGRVSIQRD